MKLLYKVETSGKVCTLAELCQRDGLRIEFHRHFRRIKPQICGKT